MRKKFPAKLRVLDELRSRIAQQAMQLRRAQETTQAGTVHEESRPENDKDTRAIESSYLARGLAQRVVEVENDLGVLRAFQPSPIPAEGRITLGALVAVEEEDSGDVANYLLVPVSGGLTITADGATVTSLTPESPLGSALVGKECGDEVEYRTPRGLIRATVVRIS